MTMAQADFNVNDFTYSGMAEADKQLLVKFFIKAKEDKHESKIQGRPIYRDVEYIDIKIPGNRTGGACRPVSQQDKNRFPEHYRRFKNRIEGEEATVGTPLSEWPPISRSMCEELRFFNVHTVEQLASMADMHASKFMGLLPIRESAKKWLENAEKDKPLWELDQKNRALRAELEEVKASLASLIEQIENPDSELNAAQRKRKLSRSVNAAKDKTSD